MAHLENLYRGKLSNGCHISQIPQFHESNTAPRSKLASRTRTYEYSLLVATEDDHDKYVGIVV